MPDTRTHKPQGGVSGVKKGPKAPTPCPKGAFFDEIRKQKPQDKHKSMASRGRKSSPVTAKLLEKVRPDRINLSAPDGVQADPERPEYLDDVGRDAWKVMVEELRSLGVLRKSDGMAIALFAQVYSRWMEALTDIRSNGLVTFTDKGSVKQNPSVVVARNCEDQLGKILAEFGLTPSSRSRLKLGTQKKSRLAKFLDPNKA